MQVAMAQLRQKPPSLFEVCNVDLRLDAIFQRLVAKAPNERFLSATDLLDAIQRANLLNQQNKQSSSSSISLPTLKILPDSPTGSGTSHSTISKTLSVIAIDLGMFTSSVAHYDPKLGPQSIQIQGVGNTARNMLWSEGEQLVIGAEAATLRQTQPDKVFHCLQRWIGLKQIERPFGGRMVPPEVPIAAILRYLSNQAQLTIPSVSHTVITIPSFYDQMHRMAIANSAKIAGLELLHLIEKPLATALSWIDTHIRLTSQSKRRTNSSILLVVHLGGTGLEASVIDVQGMQATMRGTSGNMKMGTLRWQARLAEVFSERFRTLHNRDVREDLVAAARLQRTIEMALHRLTKAAKVDVKFEWRQATISESLTHEGLLTLAAPLVEALQLAVSGACATARIDAAEIDHVVFTGSMMRIDALQKVVKRMLAAGHSSVFMEKHEIAQGAALYAQQLLPLAGNTAALPNARAVTRYDVGLLVADGQGKSKPRILIQAQSPLPAAVTRSLRSAPADQTPVLQMIESTNMGQATWHRLGSVDLSQAFPNLPAQSSLQLRLSIDESGLLTTQLFHPDTNRSVVFPTLNEGVLPPLSLPLWKAWLETVMLCASN